MPNKFKNIVKKIIATQRLSKNYLKNLFIQHCQFYYENQDYLLIKQNINNLNKTIQDLDKNIIDLIRKKTKIKEQLTLEQKKKDELQNLKYVRDYEKYLKCPDFNTNSDEEWGKVIKNLNEFKIPSKEEIKNLAINDVVGIYDQGCWRKFSIYWKETHHIEIKNKNGIIENEIENVIILYQGRGKTLFSYPQELGITQPGSILIELD